MKTWILTAGAVGATVFLMTRRGRRLQSRISDSLGDWGGTLLESSQNLQHTLEKIEHGVQRFNRALERVAS